MSDPFETKPPQIIDAGAPDIIRRRQAAQFWEEIRPKLWSKPLEGAAYFVRRNRVALEAWSRAHRRRVRFFEFLMLIVYIDAACRAIAWLIRLCL